MPSRLLALVMSLVLTPACGGSTTTRTLRESAEDDPGAGGGQRLRAVFIESADRVGVFRNFRDTALDLDCNFASVGAGVWRCLPDGAGVAQVSEVIYVDAACTEPHVAVFSSELRSCAGVRYVIARGGCAEPPRVFEVGSASRLDVRYRLIEGACVASSTGTDALTSLFSAIPIELEEFQPARLEVGIETGGIEPLELSSDDGAGIRHGFRDAADGFECRLEGADDDARCVPSEAGLVGLVFADATCSEPAAMALDCLAERDELPFARELVSEIYYRGGTRLPQSYAGSPNSCQPSPQGTAFEVGAAVSSTRFVAGARVPRVAGDVSVLAETVGTAFLPPRTMRSSAHGGHDCYFARGSDGERRCLPAPEAFSSGLFADAACTEPVESSEAAVLALEVSGACPEAVRVYARGERYQGAVYSLTDGACVFAGDRPPNDSGRSPHYVFPTELPAAEFTAVREITR